MPLREYARHRIHVDDEGFLTDRSEWTPEIAEVIAREAGIATLTPEHWKVIALCREDAARKGRSPGLARITDLTGLNTEALRALFPEGLGKLAARIAGLRKPDLS